ncbi:transposase [Thomasclavelia ramosa]|uniref:transposase n=1 Tax=Thomasclavelia ramosa TaxID=1547 RepID=UPI003AB937AD
MFKQNKSRYGVCRVYRELLNCAYHINHKRVHHIMYNLGLFSKIVDNTIDRNFGTTDVS